MAEETSAPKSPRRIRLDRAAVFAGACVLPAALVLLTFWVVGEGYYGALNSIRPVPVIGPVVSFLVRAAVSLYFPPFLVTGTADQAFAPLGLYLLFAVVYLIRRRWVHGAVLLIVPIVCTWILGAVLLHG